MKHSQTTGIITTLLLIVTCFFPWSYIVSQNITVSGFDATGTNFGKPGLLNTILGALMIIFFAIPAIWAKRTNVFVAALNLAFSFRNYLLLSACLMGECPEKKPALFVLLGLSVVIMVMALLPKIPVKKQG